MSFGSSNPPWQRNTLGNTGQQNAIANLQSQMMNTNFVGFQNLAMSNQQQQNNLALIPQLGGNMNQMNNTNTLFANHQTVQYPSRQGLNPNAFGTVQNTQQILHHQAQSQPQQAPNQVNQNNMGGQMCNSAAFKQWNTVVQQMNTTSQSHGMNVRSNTNQSQLQHSGQLTQQQQQQQSSRNFSGYNASSQSQNSYASNFERASNSVRSSNHSSRQSPPARRSSPDRSNRRDDEDRKRRKEREREREKEQEKRDDRSPARRISPQRRRARPIPRYMVQIPKYNLNASEVDVLEIRSRYTNMYIPSDFFYSRIRWSESFPCHAPLSIKKPSAFHVFHKTVENPNGADNGAELDPPDADDTFTAKVMLMSLPPMTEFHRKCFSSPEEKERNDLVHPSRLISFLVGITGKNESMAIGGAWSPSLDGPNPDKDPSVLIKTAIRTCKAMTGIDLSPCTQWFRFAELYYRRVESVRKGRTAPARTQTVVIFLPDVRSCLPTRLEWDELNIKYKRFLEVKRQSNDGKDSVDGDKKQTHAKSDEPMPDESADAEMAVDDLDKDETITDGDNTECQKNADSSQSKGATDVDTTLAVGTTSISKDEKNESTKIEPIHFSNLDVKTMKIQELRDQLEARGLLSKGLKPQLVARLSKALKAEETEAEEKKVDEPENNDSNVDLHESASNDSIMDIDLADIVVIDEYDSTKNEKNESSSKRSSSRRSDEHDFRLLERRYRLPQNPHILCHPTQQSSLEKFSCEERSLSVLLGYRSEDTKRHSFEVSLFAELFNEMLMRDFGFNIYKKLYSLPVLEPSETESKEKRDKSIDDEPKEKRHKKDADASTDSKTSKKDDSSASSHGDKDKDKDKDRDSKSGKDSKSRDKDKEKSNRERRISRRDDESGDDERSLDGKKRETKKMVIVDPDLLLSFVYFDSSHCGYIFSTHLEELFYALGLHLSRGDTKKILNKIPGSRSLFYRKLTDKPKDEAASGTPVESLENLMELGKGNNALLPSFEKVALNQSSSKSFQQPSNDEKIKSPGKSEQTGEDNTSESHMVMHKGALIDIEKLLLQLNRTERAHEETENRLSELMKSHSDLQTSNSKSKDKIKDLQSELKACNRKINDFESSVNNTSKKCNEYYSILHSIHDKISPIFIKNERKKESSNRDKDRRDREKDKNNGSMATKDKDVKDKVDDIKAEIKQEKPDKIEKAENQEKNEKPDEN